MTKIDYSQLSDFEINGMVAELTQKVGDHTQTTNKTFIHEYADVGGLKNLCVGWKEFDPCNNWSDAGPIIVEQGISIAFDKNENEWVAWGDFVFDLAGWDMKEQPAEYQHHTNPLRAAMIVFLEIQ